MKEIMSYRRRLTQMQRRILKLLPDTSSTAETSAEPESALKLTKDSVDHQFSSLYAHYGVRTARGLFRCLDAIDEELRQTHTFDHTDDTDLIAKQEPYRGFARMIADSRTGGDKGTHGSSRCSFTDSHSRKRTASRPHRMAVGVCYQQFGGHRRGFVFAHFLFVRCHLPGGLL